LFEKIIGGIFVVVLAAHFLIYGVTIAQAIVYIAVIGYFIADSIFGDKEEPRDGDDGDLRTDVDELKTKVSALMMKDGLRLKK